MLGVAVHSVLWRLRSAARSWLRSTIASGWTSPLPMRSPSRCGGSSTSGFRFSSRGGAITLPSSSVPFPRRSPGCGSARSAWARSTASFAIGWGERFRGRRCSGCTRCRAATRSIALELARALDAVAGPIDPSEPLPVPESLDHLIGERLRALPEETRAALLVVAVIGAPTLTLVETAGIAAESLCSRGGRARARARERGGPVRPSAPRVGRDRRGDRDRAAGGAPARSAAVDEPVAHARHVAAALEQVDEETAGMLEAAAGIARSRGAPSVAAELGEAAAGATPPELEDTGAGVSIRLREITSPPDRGSVRSCWLGRCSRKQRLGRHGPRR